MEELLPVVSDDLDWTETHERVPADHTRYLGYEGRWYRLDMTTEHTLEIEAFLNRYFRAGQPADTPPPRKQPSRSGKTSAAYQRNVRILEFARAKGLKYTERSSGQGMPYFPVATIRAFEEYEAAGKSNQEDQT